MGSKLSFTMENDKMALLDQYYTCGIMVSYNRSLKKDLLFFKVDKAKQQIGVALRHEVYTPRNITSTNVLDFDRPYAGWFGLATKVLSVREKQASVFGVEIGVTGRQSGAGSLQTWWHNVLNVEKPTWEQEIGNKFLINFKTKYIFNIISKKHCVLDSKIETILGLKDVNLATGVDLAFGKLNDFNNSNRIGIINKIYNREFYGVVGFNYKYVLHNTLIQGDLNYNDTNFTSLLNRHLIKIKTGVHCKWRRFLISLECYFLSKETPRSYEHAYGSLAYGYYF